MVSVLWMPTTQIPISGSSDKNIVTNLLMMKTILSSLEQLIYSHVISFKKKTTITILGQR